MRSVCLLPLMIAILLSGCAADWTRESVRETNPPVDRRTGTLPLDRYRLDTYPGGNPLDKALDTSARLCLTSLGFSEADLARVPSPSRPDTDSAQAALPEDLDFALHGSPFGEVPVPDADWAGNVPSYGCFGNALRASS
jgi:hypothetical protein